MIYKTYGNTNKKVSAVGFGGMRFDLEKTMDENTELVLYAAEKGITYFDTAPGYCNDKSETIMGKALAQLPRDSYFVSTKSMPQHAKDKQGFLDNVKKSIDTLGTEYIDFYHIWCLRKMDHYHLAMKEGMQYDALLEAQQQGLIKHIVCSSHQPGGEIRKIAEDGKVEGILMGLNILNFQYRWEGVEACVENNLGIVAMNPLSGGIIPQNEDKLQYLCNEGETAIQAALRFLIASPVTVTLNGFSEKKHIDEACAIAENVQPYSSERLEEIKNSLGESMNAVCTSCGYCVKGCPKKINIPAYMQFYNNKIMFNTSDENSKKEISNAHRWGTIVNTEGRSKDCIECGLCEKTCTQHLDIINRLKWIDTLY